MKQLNSVSTYKYTINRTIKTMYTHSEVQLYIIGGLNV